MLYAPTIPKKRRGVKNIGEPNLFALSSEGVMGEGVVGREGSFMTPPSGRDGSRDPPPPVQQRKGISGQVKPSELRFRIRWDLYLNDFPNSIP